MLSFWCGMEQVWIDNQAIDLGICRMRERDKGLRMKTTWDNLRSKNGADLSSVDGTDVSYCRSFSL